MQYSIVQLVLLRTLHMCGVQLRAARALRTCGCSYTAAANLDLCIDIWYPCGVKIRIFFSFFIYLFAAVLCACKAAPKNTAAPPMSAPPAETCTPHTPLQPAAERVEEQASQLFSDALYSAQAQTDRIEVLYEILEEGSYAAEFATAVIENQADLDRLYALLHGHSSPPAPKIDFKRKKVIAVRAGPFNTGGYAIRLYSAIDTQDGVETVFLITAPEPGQIVTQAFTTPYLIISIDVPPSKPVSVKLQRYKPEFDL